MFAPALVKPVARVSALVLAAQGGDREAFGALYEQYRRLVHGILLAHVSYSDAEDLMQTVFVRALESLGHLREADAFGGWLTAIARRVGLDHRKHRPIAIELRDVHAGRERSELPLQARQAFEAIDRLPEAYRETLILRLVEGMTGPEIAAHTGLTPESVRVNLCRGMKLLRVELGETESND